MTDAYLFAVKGIVGLIGIVLLVLHMDEATQRVRTAGQRWRYLSLFAFALATTYSSFEQLATGLAWQSRHVVALMANIVLVVAMVISIREHSSRHRDDR